jgi:glutathione peroxidase
MALPTSPADAGTAHDFAFTAIDGSPLPLSQFAGRAVLVVNTASRCGFTGQYDGLQRLWQRYRDRGLTVLGVPSNDFAGQEPGSEQDIRAFCTTGFGVDFPLTAKVHVRGSSAHPFYRWAGDRFGVLARPRWNFHKYLIGPDGQPATWFSSMTAPTAGRLVRAVEAALPKG